MQIIPFFALAADTLLVRPVDVPAPWYSIATGVLSIAALLVLLSISVAFLGMVRAIKGAEARILGTINGLTDELIPLVRNMNHMSTQLADVTTAAKVDMARLSSTVGAVDHAVRKALDVGEARLAQFGTLVDAVQDEAEATVASATGLMRGVRKGASTLATNFFARPPERQPTRDSRRNRRRLLTQDLLDEEADIRERLAALEAAFDTDVDEDDEDYDFRPWRKPRPHGSASAQATEDADLQADSVADDMDDDDIGPEDAFEDDDAFVEDEGADADVKDSSTARTGGPRIRRRGAE